MEKIVTRGTGVRTGEYPNGSFMIPLHPDRGRFSSFDGLHLLLRWSDLTGNEPGEESPLRRGGWRSEWQLRPAHCGSSRYDAKAGDGELEMT